MDNKVVYVTDLVKNYSPEFNEEFWSGYRALESIMDKELWKELRDILLRRKLIDEVILEKYDINASDFIAAKNRILEEWRKKSEEASERGKLVHDMLRDKISSGNFNYKKLGVDDEFSYSEKKKTLSNGAYPEFSVKMDCGEYFSLSGRIDLLLVKDNKVWIVDYKTVEKIRMKTNFDLRRKKTRRMYYPMSAFDDSNFNHYQLQLSLYALMVERIYPEVTIEGLMVVHYDPKGKETVYDCQYLKKYAEALLLDHEKKIIKKNDMRKYDKID